MHKLCNGVMLTKRNINIYNTLLRCIGTKSVPRLDVGWEGREKADLCGPIQNERR